jgi:SAM-dependent methyltransferase
MQVSAREGHQVWAATYDSGLNPMLALEDRALPEVLGDVAGLRVLDVACGTGRWMTRLMQCGVRVTGLDLCAEMLARAAAKPGVSGRIAVADVSSLPVAAGSADLLLCSLAVGYFPDLDRAFREFARTVRAGGRVVIGEVHPERIAAGSTRSFSVDGESYEMRHCSYSTADILDAGALAGLQLESRRDVCFGPPEEPIFREAGMMDVFYTMSKVPAVWIASWKKP